MNEPMEERISEEKARLEEFFKLWKPGYHLILQRISPKWAEGVVAELHIEDSAGIDLMEIKDVWGGKVFRLKLLDQSRRFVTGGSIELPPIFGPPKDEGHIITPEDVNPRPKENNTVQVAQPENQQLGGLEKIVTTINGLMDNQKIVMEKLTDMAFRKATGGTSNVQTMRELIQLTEMLKGSLPDNSSDDDESESEGLGALDSPVMVQILELIKEKYAKENKTGNQEPPPPPPGHENK